MRHGRLVVIVTRDAQVLVVLLTNGNKWHYYLAVLLWHTHNKSLSHTPAICLCTLGPGTVLTGSLLKQALHQGAQYIVLVS